MNESAFNKGSIWLNVGEVTDNGHNLAGLIKVRLYAGSASAGTA